MKDYAEIPLTRGYVATVDAEDYDELAQFKWCARVKRHTVYAIRHVRRSDGGWTTEQMHRRILPIPQIVDHINGDGLDNRRSNLRPATNRQNLRNRNGLDPRNTSGFRGVRWDERDRKWAARIELGDRQLYLGRFIDATDAARAFDAAAIEHFGEFHGYLNFPELVLDGLDELHPNWLASWRHLTLPEPVQAAVSP